MPVEGPPLERGLCLHCLLLLFQHFGTERMITLLEGSAGDLLPDEELRDAQGVINSCSYVPGCSMPVLDTSGMNAHTGHAVELNTILLRAAREEPHPGRNAAILQLLGLLEYKLSADEFSVLFNNNLLLRR